MEFPEVIYEDNHLIALNKRPSDIVQGDKTGDRPLNEILKDYLKKKYDKPGNVFVGTAHRLDRPVSGVVIFAKTSKSLTRLNEIFRSRNVEKVYWAVVKNKPPKDQDILLHYLIKDEAKNKSRAYIQERAGTLKSELKYKVVAQSDNYYLLEVRPITGRHHQIRVQLSFIGCPIKGDLKYGFDRSNPDASIHLHARKIHLIHPVKNEPLTIVAPTPNESLWNYFSKQVSE
jgi:23S rRNA pseudouridine1911/1915/1917 synthase